MFKYLVLKLRLVLIREMLRQVFTPQLSVISVDDNEVPGLEYWVGRNILDPGYWGFNFEDHLEKPYHAVVTVRWFIFFIDYKLPLAEVINCADKQGFVCPGCVIQRYKHFKKTPGYKPY